MSNTSHGTKLFDECYSDLVRVMPVDTPEEFLCAAAKVSVFMRPFISTYIKPTDKQGIKDATTLMMNLAGLLICAEQDYDEARVREILDATSGASWKKL